MAWMAQSPITAGSFPISPPILAFELLREFLAFRVLTDTHFHVTRCLPLFHTDTRGWWDVRAVDVRVGYEAEDCAQLGA